MGYFEEQQGLPPGSYSADFLDIDAKAGPWLTEAQKQSPIGRGEFSEWDLDVTQRAIRLKDGEQVGAVARVEMLGTYNPADGMWLWAWANPALQPISQAVAQVRDEHSDLPEMADGAQSGNEARSWALAAAAAYLMQAEGCYRLTGEIYTFVAIFDLTRLDEQEAAEPDPEQAAQVLAEYAGPMALNLGGLLIGSLQHQGQGLDEIIEAFHGFCNNLEELARSPLGQQTPAAEEALQLAGVLRQGVVCLSLPTASADFAEGAQEMLALLRDVARRYGAWKDEADQLDQDSEA